MRHSVLLIGLGNIGMGYDFSSSSDDYVATLAKSFSLHPRFDLIGAVDSDFEKRESFLCRYKCPAYSNIKAAIKEKAKLEAVTDKISELPEFAANSQNDYGSQKSALGHN